jgi:hypothetical protein
LMTADSWDSREEKKKEKRAALVAAR